MEKDLTSLRREYSARGLDAAEVTADPFMLFNQWFEQAYATGSTDPSAMVLATSTHDGCPSARIVLLKHYDNEGLCWYTDYRSQKGQELAENPQAELLFFWPQLDRQVRIWGAVEKLSREQSQLYFNKRPAESRFSAAASIQSSIVGSREALVESVEALKAETGSGDVACPEQWGGYRLRPERFEFWQGRENRLHDRLVFSRQLQGWQNVRLAP